jgi:hypothetical protein
MMKSVNAIFGKAFLILVILYVAAPSAVYGWTDVSRHHTIRVAPVVSPQTSPISGVQESAGLNDAAISETGDSLEGKIDRASFFRPYITPDDQDVMALAAGMDRPEDAYQTALSWVYVSDEKLNQDADHWLTPHEFLTGTPVYANNPLPGEAVSDCEEKANTLVSLLRAKGVRPENVRVVLGEVSFNDIKMGHAWVELLTDGNWLVLDTCWGPYWDDKTGQLVNRRGVPFNYYAGHAYPVLQVWDYYNDAYYLDLRDGSGNAPDFWR